MSDLFLDTHDVTPSPSSTISSSDSEIDTYDQTKISPMRRRSVKEYDEQLSALKKENFNLKLRIYFLEEKMGSAFPLEDKDNIIRKNVEYQVQVETLRRELDEKQDLLCQAVKALELEDEEHKKVVLAKNILLSNHNERIEMLEEQVKALSETNAALLLKPDPTEESPIIPCIDTFSLQSANTKAQSEIENLTDIIADLQLQLAEERTLRVENNSSKVKNLEIHCVTLESELEENKKKIESLTKELEQKTQTIFSYTFRVRSMEDTIQSKSNDLKQKLDEIIQKNKVIQDQQNKLDELMKEVENFRIRYENEFNHMDNFKIAVKSRDTTIADLESKLEKCKTVIRNLEGKLDLMAHENKKQKDELQAMKQQRRLKSGADYLDYSPQRLLSPQQPSSTSSSLFDVIDHPHNLLRADKEEIVSQLKEEIKTKDSLLSKLEEDQKGACNLIQKFITHTKTLERDLAETKAILSKKEKQLEEFKAKQKPAYNVGTSSSSYNVDQENSVEESDQDVAAIPDESDCDSTTLEWEKQIEALMEIIQDKEMELVELKKTMEEKDNRIIELESELTEMKFKLSEVNEKLVELKSENPNDNSTVEDKNKKIEQLESDVRKHTFNLQGIVNTELWEKNREIEKLQNKLKLKEQEVAKLEVNFGIREMQMKVLKDKIAELGVSDAEGGSLSLEEQLKASNEKCRNLNIKIEQLTQQLRNKPERDSDITSDYIILQQDFEKSEKLRSETVNLCSLLTTRLEELAYFLDSLLKHKSVLGVLGSKQRSVIKQAIDQSLDLSKSLSVSMMNEDQSLAQLSSISELLNTSQQSILSLFDTTRDENRNVNTSLTYNSHLSRKRESNVQNDVAAEQAEIINVLRAQIETLKKEIELRDMELCKQTETSLKNDNDLVEQLFNMQSYTADLLSPVKIYNKLCADLSESEAWSEPDRYVSKARIGLETSVDSSRSKPREASIEDASSDSTEHNRRSRNRTPSKRNSGSVDSRHTIQILQDNIGALENKLKDKENEVLTLKTKITDLDDKLLDLRLKSSEEIAKLTNEKLEIDGLLKEMEEKLKQKDTTAQTYDNKELEYKSELENKEREYKNELDNKDREYKIELDNKEREYRNKLDDIERELENKELHYKNELSLTEDKWNCVVQNMEQNAELKLSAIQNVADELKKQYELELTRKEEMNQRLAEMQAIYLEFDVLKEVLKQTDLKIKEIEMNEVELKRKLQESEDSSREKIIGLKREINEATLRISQAVLERTKINNEKLRLESEIRKLESRESDRCRELDEKDKEFINMKNNLQKQITQIEQQKSNLQLRVSELETTNAELRNRLVKLQTNHLETVWSKNAASSPPKISDLLTNFKIGKHSLAGLLRPRGDMSGYASEDVLTDDNEGGVFNRSAPETYWFGQEANANDVRHVANSSPDLGIESDQGRFSSLETNVATTRPLLQTLELTASMNNLLAANHLNNSENFCNILVHKDLEVENVELKKTVLCLETNLNRVRSQLSVINQNKKQVEKAVCKQIHKTSIVLRQARANLDSSSENESKRK